jgi:hypothetical protein
LDNLPEIRWAHDDDLCDCTFQNIGWWTNPYIGKTFEIRLCCAWAKLVELHPELGAFVREIPAFDNYNTGKYENSVRDWDGEDDMPRAVWMRQLATAASKPLEQVRREYDHLEPPKGDRGKAAMLRFLRAEAEKLGIGIDIRNVS